MRKPRIAYLLQMFGIGGMPKWLFHLARELQNEFDFTFIATHSYYVRPEYQEAARVLTLPFKKWPLAAVLRARGIDLAQVANLRLYTEAARLARVPVVIERTDGLRSGAALNSKEGLDLVIASTEGVRPHLEELIAADKIRVIYNGVDLAAFEGARAERFGFADEDVIIGRTSRLAGGKNISLLIRAVIELRKEAKYSHVRLVVCGGDNTQRGAIPMLDTLKAEAAPLGDSAMFSGEVFDPTPITLGYDIATCTSQPNNEGIPNSLIEAMAAGKAVVASAVDDIPELVEDGKTGLLFASDDVVGLVAALKTLVDDKDLRNRMGRAGRARVERDFDLAKQARKYADVYWELLDKKGRGG
ncbi:MAG: glycosyltransferase family 1 protein [Chloroflexi bacterium]|nr:glycosyltransferase family 1 protein [Chloroflexota bacterium]